MSKKYFKYLNEDVSANEFFRLSNERIKKNKKLKEERRMILFCKLITIFCIMIAAFLLICMLLGFCDIMRMLP
jgi:hypothetical protein